MANKYLEFINKIFKYLITVKTIMLARFCCGLYYEISSNEMISIAAKVYCVVCGIVFNSQIEYSFLSISSTLDQVVTAVFYNVCFLSSLLGISEEMNTFLSDLERVDRLFDVALDIDVPVARILLPGVVLQKLAVTILWCIITNYSCQKMLFEIIMRALFLNSMMLSGFTRIMIFELTLYRMKSLRASLNRRLLASRLDESRIAREIKQCMIIYKNLLDVYKNIDTSLKIMILSSVMFVLPKVVVLVYLLHDVQYFGVETTTVIFLNSFLISSLLLLPGVLATLTSREVNKIKRLILKQLFVCKGEATDYDLNEAIEDSLLYIEQRPYKFTVWRLFTVDMTMILGVVGLAITCCLATVQFEHFYG